MPPWGEEGPLHTHPEWLTAQKWEWLWVELNSIKLGAGCCQGEFPVTKRDPDTVSSWCSSPPASPVISVQFELWSWCPGLVTLCPFPCPCLLLTSPAHISFSPGQGRTRKQPWKRLEWWVLRGSQGSSKIVLYIAEIKHTIHSILTPRSKTWQRLHEYQALHKLTRYLQYPALPNWEKSWLNGNTKIHCNRKPSTSKCCPLPAAPVPHCASCLTHPITHSIFLQEIFLASVALHQRWLCRGLARSWVIPLALWCSGALPHVTGNRLIRL